MPKAKKGKKKVKAEKKPETDQPPEEIPEYKLPLPKHGWMKLKVSPLPLTICSCCYANQLNHYLKTNSKC